MNSSSDLHASLNQLRALNREQLLNIMSKWIQPVIMILAVIGIAWQLAQLTWLILQPKSNAMPVPVIVNPLPASANHSVNTQAIADTHLFGIAAPASSDSDPNNLPQTQISLVLAGTIAFHDPQAGFAIVGENASAAKFYKVGAAINGAIHLHAVYTDRVIIDRAGVLETLSLPHGPSLSAPPPIRPNPGAQFGDNIRRLASSNPTVLSQMLRVQPVFANGVQKGYRVYPGRERAQFARLGLQPGDLITSINGTMLNDPGVTNDILGLLSSSSTVSVSIERNGNTMQLNLDISQITLPDENTPASPQESATDPGAVAPMNRGRIMPPPNPTSPSAQ